MLFDHLEKAMRGTPQENEFDRLFNGHRESVIKCTEIDYESVKKETFTSIQIHMQESDTLENAIRELFKAEDLSGENKYDAGDKGMQPAKKFMRIKTLPPILQININRFGNSKDGGYQKINSVCDFAETLDMDRLLEHTDSFILSQQSSQKSSVRKSSKNSQRASQNQYRLHAILVHNGAINYGHYFCFLKPRPADDTSLPKDQWYKFNDTVVTRVPKS